VTDRAVACGDGDSMRRATDVRSVPVATFKYIAVSATGERVQGALSGASEQAVIAELENRQLMPVELSPQAESSPGARGISLRALGQTYEQLADLLHAGVPLLRGLRLLGGRKGNPKLSAVFRELAEAVEKGADLGQAMSERPAVFPTVQVAMVRAGERGGFLEKVLARLGALITAQADLRGKVIGSLVYPGLLVTAGLGIVGVIFWKFVPKFKPMFAKLGDQLPGVTKLVFAVSDGLGRYAPFTLAGVIVLAFAWWRFSRRKAVRDSIEQYKLRLPVLGGLLRSYATVRFCQMLGTMLDNGVPMLAALAIAKDGTGHPLFARTIETAIERVRSGGHLTDPLRESGLFDDDVIEMIAIGEAANNLDEVLLKIASTMERRLDRLLTIAVRLIEPLLLMIIAGVVGIVAAALLLPMSKLGDAI